MTQYQTKLEVIQLLVDKYASIAYLYILSYISYVLHIHT